MPRKCFLWGHGARVCWQTCQLPLAGLPGQVSGACEARPDCRVRSQSALADMPIAAAYATIAQMLAGNSRSAVQVDTPPSPCQDPGWMCLRQSVLADVGIAMG